MIATIAAADPLPASYKPVGASKTQWISPPLSAAEADKAWRALASKPGFVAIILDRAPNGDNASAQDDKKPLSLASARASLEKKRKAEHDFILDVLAKNPKVPAGEAAAYRAEWSAWTSQLPRAIITADDRKDAADLVAADARGVDMQGKAQTFYLLAIAGAVDGVVASFEGYNGSPGGDELAPFLARWNKAYGARPYAWDGYQFTLDVPRPPTKLAELRALAADFALACPYDRSGVGTIGLGEPPGHLMARLEQKRWVCYWFEE